MPVIKENASRQSVWKTEISPVILHELTAIAEDFSTRTGKASEEALIYIDFSGVSEPEALKLNF